MLFFSKFHSSPEQTCIIKLVLNCYYILNFISKIFVETCFLLYSLYMTPSVLPLGRQSPKYALSGPLQKRFADPCSISSGFFFSFFQLLLHGQGQRSLRFWKASWEVWCGASCHHSLGEAGYSVAGRQRSPPWPPMEAHALFFLGVCRTLFIPVTSLHWTAGFSSAGSPWNSAASQVSCREMYPKYLLNEWAVTPGWPFWVASFKSSLDYQRECAFFRQKLL